MSEFVNAAPIVNAIRYAVKVPWATFVQENSVTRANLNETAVALVALALPNEPTVQTVKDEQGRKVRTVYGTALNTAKVGLSSALDKVEGKAPTALLTALGKSAELADVIAAWEAAQS